MAAAAVTERDLASILAVDPKTVLRWMANEERTPHARHRWAVAEKLGVEEHVLWPKAVRSAIKTGVDREVVAVYPYRSALPRSIWADLIANAERELMFAGYTNYFLWTEVPRLREILQERATAGVHVRFLLGNPEADATRRREDVEDAALDVTTRIKMTLAELEHLKDVEGIETRVTDAEKHIHLSVFRMDDHAIVSQHLANLLGHDSPTMHLQRREDDGLFDRFTFHVEYLWGQSTALEN